MTDLQCDVIVGGRRRTTIKLLGNNALCANR
jgi:hypothetical protein